MKKRSGNFARPFLFNYPNSVLILNALQCIEGLRLKHRDSIGDLVVFRKCPVDRVELYPRWCVLGAGSKLHKEVAYAIVLLIGDESIALTSDFLPEFVCADEGRLAKFGLFIRFGGAGKQVGAKIVPESVHRQHPFT